jgi:hypothetical protein
MKSLLLSILLITTAYAEDQNGGWLGTFTKKELTQDYHLWAETQVRYNFELGATGQILYRTGLLQDLDQTHQLGYLYAYIQGGVLKEHRFTFQHGMQYGSRNGFRFSHRARLEARFLEKSDDDAARFRYLLRAQSKISEKYDLVVWDELFVNLSKEEWTGDRDFERNRFFVGVRRKFFNSNMEYGYLNQYIVKDDEDIIQHIAVFYLFL